MALVTLLLNRAWGPEPAPLLVALALGAVMAAALGILVGAFLKDMNMLMSVVKAGGIFLTAGWSTCFTKSRNGSGASSRRSST